MTGRALIELVGVDAPSEADPDRTLVADVDWSIGAGEFWVVCGGSDSGKSALLNVAAALLPPRRGMVRIFGQDQAEADERERTRWRRRIGFVFEGGGRLIGHLSVAENVILASRYHENLDLEEARARALAILALAGLESLADAWPSRLSVAMQQRVALLRAIAQPIEVLFLDSPLRGLAPGDARWCLGFVRELRDRRAAEGNPIAVVASGYDPGAWRELADHFAWLEDGRMQQKPLPPGDAP